ncbi:MAG: SpoIIE family protein phosphatase [Bacteroidales bacterium]|nr:SpoIIE family protein phosphatase [Bacteroidales bacterium]
MNMLLDKFRRSLPARLSVWIVLFVTLVLLAALGYQFYTSRRAVRREAIALATQQLNNVVLRVNNILDDARIAADNMDWLVYEHLDDPDMMNVLARNLILNNPQLQGCSISFEPGFYPSKGRYFSPYAYYEDGSVLLHQEGSDDYQYFYMDWYQLPKLLNQPCWTEPYMDVDPKDDTAEMVTTYCKPLTGYDGRFVGVLSVDLSLSWLSETISSVRPYPNAYSIMIGRGGSYLVHPEPEKLLNQSIFTQTLLVPDEKLSELGHAMQRGESGMREFRIDGKRAYVFFEPVKSTGWSVAIVCTHSDIFGGYHRLRRTINAIVILGLLLIFFVVIWVVSRELSPLSQLVEQTSAIATGHFDEQLPPSDRVDEIGQLTEAFGNMQTSLVKYIDELTRTTANKERIEGEIRIAHDIQMGMVPRVFPAFPERKDIDLFASMTPAREVGGDLYDYFIKSGKFYFCIGDVSGKGVPASLFMAVARNLFRVVGRQGLSPKMIAHQINETLAADNDQMMFVTMFIGVVDLETGAMEFCNCGHNPPVLFGDGAARFLDVKPNTPLGIASGFWFDEERIADVRDQSFLFYTDGLNEAENRQHGQFGEDRVLEQLRGPFVSAKETILEMKKKVAGFVGDAEASDDLTLLCLRISKIRAQA